MSFPIEHPSPFLLDSAILKAENEGLTKEGWRSALKLFSKKVVEHVLPKICPGVLLDFPVVKSWSDEMLLCSLRVSIPTNHQADLLEAVDPRLLRTRGIFFLKGVSHLPAGPVKEFFGILETGEWIEGVLFLLFDHGTERVKSIHVSVIDFSFISDPISKTVALVTWISDRRDPVIIADPDASDLLHIAGRFVRVAQEFPLLLIARDESASF